MKAPSKAKVKETANKAVKTTAKAAKSTGNFISKNPKATLYLGLGVLGVFVAYKIYKSVTSVTDVFKEDPAAGGGKLDTIKNPSLKPLGATINLTQAQTVAANILSAVDGWGGVNEKEYMVIENALRGKTPEDFQMISNAFGTPKRSPVTGEQSFWFFGEKLNLSQWLTQELDNKQKARLQTAAPLIF